MSAEDLLKRLLVEIGADTGDDAELEETPRRVAELLKAWLVPSPSPPDVAISEVGAGGAGPTIIADVPFHSFCVHHLVPFFGHVHVAYLPGESIVGFGSVGRVVDHFARRPQLQERLTRQVGELLYERLEPEALVVASRARQLCVEMAGHEGSARTVSIFGFGSWAGEMAWDVGSRLLAGAED